MTKEKKMMQLLEKMFAYVKPESSCFFSAVDKLAPFAAFCLQSQGSCSALL